jgi:hypothetical protein
VVKKSAPVYELSDLHAHHYLKTEWEWRRENDASKRMGVTKGCANLDTVHVQKNHFADVELPEARLVSFIYLELITSKVPEGYKNRCTTQLAQRKKNKTKNKSPSPDTVIDEPDATINQIRRSPISKML